MKWVLLQSDEAAVAKLSEEAKLHPLLATILVNRGIADPSEARAFLDSGLDGLADPGVFLHMERAVGRVREAIKRRERITVYGDYDVDGVTGSALLYLALRELGAEVDHYFPDRLTEGYGLNPAAFDRIKEAGGRLVISVDCGISAHAAAAHARSLGLDLIITDHHEFGAQTGGEEALPEATAILHPTVLRPGVDARTAEHLGVITGVGVAFKLAQALLGDGNGIISHLDLAALGTVADMGRITGENRILVKHGLDVLSRDGGRTGVAALKRAAGLNGKRVTAGTIGFSLAPRLNASGRMERADAAFHLLTTGSDEEASRLAQEIESANRERQAVEERIAGEARELCVRMGAERTAAFVLASRDWHPGVIGIVASRIVDAFYRPTALIALQDGVGKGSARSIPGFDLYQGLRECAELLIGFGGHKYAAGFSIAEKNIPAFRERLDGIVHGRIGPEGFTRTIAIDGSVKLDELTLPLLRDLERLAPFGTGNGEPRLGSRGLTVVSARTVGNNHLKLRLRQGRGAPVDAIAFNRGDLLGGAVRVNGRIAAIFSPRLSHWNGTTAVELEIRDVKIDA